MEIFRAENRMQWREWLESHFETEREIWLVFPSVSSGEVSVTYNDAVEEALCFGWIDGRAGTLDANHGIRRFTPRRASSSYSRPNVERLIWLDARAMIHPKVRPGVLPLIRTPYEFPEDIVDAVCGDPAVKSNYDNFTEPYKRIRVAYIDAARERPEEFRKRLQNFISKTRDGKIISGYGGIDKYYL